MPVTVIVTSSVPPGATDVTPSKDRVAVALGVVCAAKGIGASRPIETAIPASRIKTFLIKRSLLYVPFALAAQARSGVLRISPLAARANGTLSFWSYAVPSACRLAIICDVLLEYSYYLRLGVLASNVDIEGRNHLNLTYAAVAVGVTQDSAASRAHRYRHVHVVGSALAVGDGHPNVVVVLCQRRAGPRWSSADRCHCRC